MMNESESAPISVVIPCYCCLATLERAVYSVLRQTLSPREIILVDDCSDDQTPQLLRALEKQYGGLIKIVLLAKNGGAATARNAGWMIATQPYIAFLDADDSWNCNKLHLQYALMSSRYDIALCGHQCALHLGEESHSPLATSFNETEIRAVNMLFKSPFNTPTVMLKRDMPLRFEEGRRFGEDILLWQQIAFSGLKVIRMEIPLAYVHKPLYGAGGLSQQLWSMEKGELSNLTSHYEAGNMGVLMLILSTGFSLLKFLRRFVVVQRSRLVASWTRVAGI